MGKENVNNNIQSLGLTEEDNSKERRKRTAHFLNPKLEYIAQKEVKQPFHHHKKSYSYLNSNADHDTPAKSMSEENLTENESEFEFMMSYNELASHHESEMTN